MIDYSQSPMEVGTTLELEDVIELFSDMEITQDGYVFVVAELTIGKLTTTKSSVRQKDEFYRVIDSTDNNFKVGDRDWEKFDNIFQF